MKSRPVKKKPANSKAGKATEVDITDAVEKKSRLQRHRTKQVRFLARLEDSQRNLSAKKTIVKKERKRTREKAGKVLETLSSLADSLPSQEEIIASAQALKKKTLRSRTRQQLVVKETRQLAAVLAHPGFQTNPFLTIQEHLTNTVPVGTSSIVKQERGSKTKKKKKVTKKKSSVQHMEE